MYDYYLWKAAYYSKNYGPVLFRGVPTQDIDAGQSTKNANIWKAYGKSSYELAKAGEYMFVGQVAFVGVIAGGFIAAPYLAAGGEVTAVAGAEGTSISTEVSETTLQHIFREAPGHVNPATIQSQTRFLNLFSRVASNPNNLVQTANEAARAAGVQTFKQVFKNGEVWVQIFKGQIRNAGVNILP